MRIWKKILKHYNSWKLFVLNILFMWTGYFIQSGALVYYYKYYVGSTSLSSLVTPYLVSEGRIQKTMFGFAGIVLISAVAGISMIRLQKKYGIAQMK